MDTDSQNTATTMQLGLHDHITKHQLLVVYWVLFGIATSFSAGRIAIRLHFNKKKLLLDDAFALLALLFLLAHIIILTILLNWLWLTNLLNSLVTGGPAAVAPGQAQPQNASLTATPGGTSTVKRDILLGRSAAVNHLSKREDIVWDIIFFMRLEYISQLLFWSCLWAVKASFLSFFRRLSANVRIYKDAWRILVVLTAIGFIVCIASYPYPCLSFSSCKPIFRLLLENLIESRLILPSRLPAATNSAHKSHPSPLYSFRCHHRRPDHCLANVTSNVGPIAPENETGPVRHIRSWWIHHDHGHSASHFDQWWSWRQS